MASCSMMPCPPLAALAPDLVFHVGGLSKAVAAGLRGGWVACPPNFAGRVSVAHKMITGGKAFPRHRDRGAAGAIRRRLRIPHATLGEIASRVALAREAFAGLDVRLHDRVPFILADVARAVAFGRLQERRRGAEASSSTTRMTTRPVRSDKVYHAVRIGFSAVPDLGRVAEGFRTLRRLLDQGQRPTTTTTDGRPVDCFPPPVFLTAWPR